MTTFSNRLKVPTKAYHFKQSSLNPEVYQKCPRSLGCLKDLFANPTIAFFAADEFYRKCEDDTKFPNTQRKFVEFCEAIGFKLTKSVVESFPSLHKVTQYISED